MLVGYQEQEKRDKGEVLAIDCALLRRSDGL